MGLSNTPTWWAIVIALGIPLVSLYWDVQSRPNKLRWVRFAALIMVVGSLFLLHVSPYQTSPSKMKNVAWMTGNSASEIADSLTNEGFVLIENNEAYKKIKSSNGIEQLIVVGDGLEEWELEQVDQVDTFIPTKSLEEGVEDYVLGKAMEQSPLEITLQLNLSESTTLTLSGSGIETITKEATAEQANIQLEVLPSIVGYLTYQLDGIRAGDTLFSETIPVEVKKKRQTNVLMLANTPSFEFRGLKNYLAEAGFGIAERLKVSSDLYHQAFTNLNERKLTSLTNRLLDDFQLIVMDATVYDDLTRAEQQRIKTKLEKGEVGLVLMGGRGANNLVVWKNRKRETISLKGDNGDVKLTSTTLEMAGSSNLRYGSNSIAQMKSYGLGQIVHPLFTDSYILKLQAEKQLFARIWQTVLGDAIGKMEGFPLVQTAEFPHVNEPTNIQLTSNGIEELKVNGTRLAPSQEWFSSYSWNATYWPQKRGWQTAIIDGEEKARFFAFDSTDWTLQKRLKKRVQTAAFVLKERAADSTYQPIKTPISKWIFFGLFLVGITFLWVEQRIS